MFNLKCYSINAHLQAPLLSGSNFQIGENARQNLRSPTGPLVRRVTPQNGRQRACERCIETELFNTDCTECAWRRHRHTELSVEQGLSQEARQHRSTGTDILITERQTANRVLPTYRTYERPQSHFATRFPLGDHTENSVDSDWTTLCIYPIVRTSRRRCRNKEVLSGFVELGECGSSCT